MGVEHICVGVDSFLLAKALETCCPPFVRIPACQTDLLRDTFAMSRFCRNRNSHMSFLSRNNSTNIDTTQIHSGAHLLSTSRLTRLR